MLVLELEELKCRSVLLLYYKKVCVNPVGSAPRSVTTVVRYVVIINYFMHVSRQIGVKFNVAYALFAIIKVPTGV